MEFTEQDLNVLFEAVEVWEREDRGPGFFGAIMTGMMSDQSPEAAGKIQEKMTSLQKKADDERRTRKERGVMLRAKLITLRDKVYAQKFCESIRFTPADT